MDLPASETQQLISACLKERITGEAELEVFLKHKGVAASQIPVIIQKALAVALIRRAAKRRIQEGSVVTAIGFAGISYSFLAKVDGVVWLIWSMAGLGILGSGLLKRYKVKQYN